MLSILTPHNVRKSICRINSINCHRHIHINHNDDDHQNPTYYRVGEKVKEEPKRSTMANQLDNRLIMMMMMILMMITMMMMMMIDEEDDNFD